jgi:hypothetical protein
MRIRYVGDDAGRLVPLPEGDTVHVDRREWLDTTPEHARSLAQSDEWELETVVKAKRTRAANAKAEEASPEPEPVVPDVHVEAPSGEENVK